MLLTRGPWLLTVGLQHASGATSSPTFVPPSLLFSLHKCTPLSILFLFVSYLPHHRDTHYRSPLHALPSSPPKTILRSPSLPPSSLTSCSFSTNRYPSSLPFCPCSFSHPYSSNAFYARLNTPPSQFLPPLKNPSRPAATPPRSQAEARPHGPGFPPPSNDSSRH